MQMFYFSSRHFSPGTSLVRSVRNIKPIQEEGDSPAREQTAATAGRPRNRINMLLLMLACLAVLSIFFQLISPALAESLANGLPASWVRTSSEQVLSEMDGNILRPSTIPPASQDDLRERFAALNPPAEGAPPYRLLFRDSRLAGATLLSLPGGEIIITDAFMRNIADHDEQLALLCHELGHLYHHHALRTAIAQQLPRLAWAAFIGSSDASIRALTAGLHQSELGLQQVLEADRYAVAMLQANHLPVQVLIRAIGHGQRPLETAVNGDAASHRRFFDDRINMLQNFR